MIWSSDSGGDIINNQGSFFSSQPIIYTKLIDTDENTNFGDTFNFNHSTEASFSWFFKIGALTDNIHFADKYAGSSPFRGYNIKLNTDGTLFIIFANGTGNRIRMTSNETITDTLSFHTLVVTLDGSNTAAGIVAYLDKVPLTFVAAQDNLGARTFTTTEDFTTKGICSFDKYSFWDKKLTQVEVNHIDDLGRFPYIYDISNLITLIEYDTLNPQDSVGTNHGTSTLMDGGNIIDDSDIADNQGSIWEII